MIPCSIFDIRFLKVTLPIWQSFFFRFDRLLVWPAVRLGGTPKAYRLRHSCPAGASFSCAVSVKA
ncbi:hypothetical protein D1AOALGA4SA_11623 [Olavius algarvensis Delta 1 endosymbiont]|nr:hypothetical protein D1AOALGA4SA_11623 [Olavius algarvensis Delta 1 endosymbiont]